MPTRTTTAVNSAPIDNTGELIGASDAQPSGETTLPEFVPGTYYDLTLSKPVEYPAGSGNFMRPGQTLHVDGAACLELKDAVSGAIAVPA